MSLFSELSQWEIIQNPARTYRNYKLLEEKKEKTPEEEKAEWKALCKQKKAELGPEEFKKWKYKTLYEKNREYRIAKQKALHDNKKIEQEEMFREVMDEVWGNAPEYLDIDKYYLDKFDADDRDSSGRFMFYRRCSRLNKEKITKFKPITQPVKIVHREWFGNFFSRLWAMQQRAYEYMLPYYGEINIEDFKLAKRQYFTKKPMWTAKWKIVDLVAATDISQNQIYSVTSAVLRDKYIQSELFMGRVSYLVGDIIITQAGNILRPSLKNNLPWLTEDTVDELHEKRIQRLKKEVDDLPVYTLWDTYLIKIKPNERETYYYLVPTSKNFSW